MELPRLVEIHEKYEDRGVRVVSIDSGERTQAAEEFLDENGVRHLVLSDLEDGVMDDYRIYAIPVTAMIDHEGRVMYRHIGFAPEMQERFEKELDALISWRDEART